ncbi:OLC1v1010324C2 [Oldenlandia corymbosa var. corymbosa]|uniref:OLC1v1010324C2 n=1 Tax=Oldenlandia corymbosa var. corymbosa TaxID=529605 RepID=A0AAV1DR15_OLDCO|nr:OLC1v1010324C2 [Oldenlandia corymbosa var. corymbosa]
MKFWSEEKKMGDDQLPVWPSDRAVEQAIVSLKKGAQLLKYGRRGKPKFCPFRLSMDEKSLIWFSGQMEKQMKLSSATSITRGQNLKQMQPEKESQSLSVIYANGERSLNLICKDKEQADSWYLGLKAIISRNHTQRLFCSLKNQRGSQSCVSSPASFMRMKQIIGLSDGTTKSSQVHSVNGSPMQSLSERCSDDLSCSSGSFYSNSSVSSRQSVVDMLTSSPYQKQGEANCGKVENQTHNLSQYGKPPHGTAQIKMETLRDLLIWGEGVDGGCFAGGDVQCDALIPKVMDSTMMLDVQSLSLGTKHAALVTKQGEVFCWGEGKKGRLGHKIDADTPIPKIVGSLSGLFAKSVSCGEYHTTTLTDSGELYTWGDNGCNADSLGGESKLCHWLPHRLSGVLDGVSIVNVACGQWHTAAVSATGQLFTFGDGTFGVLGHGNVLSVSQPKEVESLSGFWVKSVACGPWHTAAIVEVKTDSSRIMRKGGKLFTWGDGDKGKLGHSDQERKLLPTCVTELVDHDFVQVACGDMLTVGLTNMGKVYAMGSAVHGQLGNPHARDKSITIVQGKIRDEYVKSISAGSFHIAALTSRGNVFTWGKGANGQLGLGDTRDRNHPTLVEALRDRQVEHITCGSNSTGAICLHKSLDTTDQAFCRGCGTAFGFTRKKQNCYNCGLLFCRGCCSKKATNASLAPTKAKPFRVCDPCFKKLLRVADSGGLQKLEAQSPRPLSLPQKVMPDDKEYSGEASGAWSRRKLTKTSLDDKDKQPPLDLTAPILGGLQRWEQVPCSESFKIQSRDQTIPSLSSKLPSLKTQLSSTVAVYQDLRPVIQTPTVAVVKEGRNLSQFDKLLAAEVDRLKIEVESLKKLCQTRKEKIEECQQKVVEAWSIAKEEAEKSKAAKEVIKALTSRLYTMSEKLTTERNSEHQDGANLQQITCDRDSTLNRRCGSAVHEPCESIEDRTGDSICSSPIVFSSTVKHLRDQDHQGDVAVAEQPNTRKTGQVIQGTNSLMHEWVEKYQQGVYITLATLPNGQISLRRIKFSRKKFTEREAERWWDENQQLVHQKYKIEEFTNPICDGTVKFPSAS